MPAKIITLAVNGLEAERVEVEADTGGGDLGSFAVVGLPDLAVSEARERVRAAIRNSGWDFPKLKVTVNLAPAGLRKQGSGFDLPIALSVLVATGKLKLAAWPAAAFIGELALDGRLRPVNGLLAMARQAKRLGMAQLFVPAANAAEAALVEGVAVYGLESLSQLSKVLSGQLSLTPTAKPNFSLANPPELSDLAHIAGQAAAKRALEIAAAGGHNLLMSGPPGSGKTMLAKSLPSILPDLNIEEALELTTIYSVAGLLSEGQALVTSRPFRAPHHSASAVSLVGGGAWPRPGEISLAHRGVLFLDELPEFPRQVLENLRQPLEEGRVQIARAAGSLSFPSRFVLVAAMNPCPCGFWGDRQRDCQCSPMQLAAYGRRLSGPLLDRFDLRLQVPRLEYQELNHRGAAEGSAAVKLRVMAARAKQAERFRGSRMMVNAEMSSQQVRQFCSLDSAGEALMKTAVDRLKLSPRAYFRLLKTARTIADLADSSHIAEEHLAEALQYRLS